MVEVTVSIPEEVLLDKQLTKQSAEIIVKRAISLFFYTKLGVSIEYCSAIADMTKAEFIRFLYENNSRPYESTSRKGDR
nr:UPF0175 family protein [uncultured Ruminococcus sp.]